MNGPPSLRVSTTDPTPPFEQLRRQFAELIRSGLIPAGDRLPPLRQLAADLGLAVGTVARTYRELEAAGLVVSRRGGGTRVRPIAPARTAAQRRRVLGEQADGFVRQARLLGADDDEVRAALTAALGRAGRRPS
ncbi:GntR family transcriptional regulator [Trujillonella humicola]|uniref:GntR family transcriptional regulator n=1 Tax=Trujillonella humicola TaxID=3383699 RepID=UPI003906CCCB